MGEKAAGISSCLVSESVGSFDSPVAVIDAVAGVVTPELFGGLSNRLEADSAEDGAAATGARAGAAVGGLGLSQLVSFVLELK